MGGLVLAVKATLDTDKVGSLRDMIPDPVKDFLLAIHFQDWAFWALLAGAAILLFRFLGGVGKLVMLGIGAVMLYGWAGDGGFVKVANLLSSDAGMWTALIVGGGLAIMKFGKAQRKPVPTLKLRGRRGR